MLKTKRWGNIKAANEDTTVNPSSPSSSPMKQIGEQEIMMPANSSGKIEVVENKIYFYSDIDDQSILALNKILTETANLLLWRAQITMTEVAPIYLYIRSDGGSIFSGLSAMDEIINSQVPIVTIVDGLAASAGTFLSVVGHKRLIKKHSFILIHELRSGLWGSYSDIIDEKENLDKLMNLLKGIYKQFTKIPMKKLEQILKHDLIITAKEAKDYGLVDDII